MKVRSWWAEGEVMSAWLTSELSVAVVHGVCWPLYIGAHLMGFVFCNELLSILKLFRIPPFIVLRPITLPS